jgi:hypothetical protein
MKHLATAIVFTLAFSFCKNEDRSFRLSDHYSKFKYHDLKTFDLDTFRFDGVTTQHFERLDSIACVHVFQHTNEDWLSKSFFYFSTFKDPTLISILEESDDSGFIIWLLKYDRNGKLKSKIPISGGSCGCLNCYRLTGKSVGNNTFMSTEVNSIYLNESKNGNITIAPTDSLILKINFNSDETIRIDTLLNQKIKILETNGN